MRGFAAIGPRRERRYASVEVHVSEYVTAEVPLSDIPTDKLIAELKDRQHNPTALYTANGEIADGYGIFTLNVSELWAIRHLYMLGREAEASDRCRVLLADMLGTAL